MRKIPPMVLPPAPLVIPPPKLFPTLDPLILTSSPNAGSSFGTFLWFFSASPFLTATIIATLAKLSASYPPLSLLFSGSICLNTTVITSFFCSERCIASSLPSVPSQVWYYLMFLHTSRFSQAWSPSGSPCCPPPRAFIHAFSPDLNTLFPHVFIQSYHTWKSRSSPT